MCARRKKSLVVTPHQYVNDAVRFPKKQVLLLMYCEKKILFQLKNKLKTTNYKTSEHG
jgi:hypothetical protein